MRRDTRARILLASAVAVLRGEAGYHSGDGTACSNEVGVKPYNRYLDKTTLDALKSGFSIDQQVIQPHLKEPIMAKAKPAGKTATKAPATEVTTGTPEANTKVEHADGTTEVMNPTPVTAQDKAAEAAQAKIEAKATKAKAAAEKKAEAEAKRAERNEQIRANKEARAKRLEEVAAGGERTYLGSMLALADRVKEGVYVKASTGQLRSNDELALALDEVPVDNVIQLAKIMLELEVNPYTKLNMGQQSMNLRNRMRGALKKGTLTITKIKEVIEAEGFATYKGHAEKVAAEKEAKAKAKAEKEAAKAKADADKAAVKAKEPEGETAAA